MGLSESLRRRMTMVQGEPFGTAIKVFFADQKTRRAFELQKFGRYLKDPVSPAPAAAPSKKATKKKAPAAPSIATHLDRGWYAQANGLDVSADALNHYREEGIKWALAPFPELAGKNGRTLSTWGVEYLVRMGLPVGDFGENALTPGDPCALDPFKITNPGAKRIAVVTAIFGQFDALIPIDETWRANADFFVVSDRNYEATSGWQKVHAPFHHEDPRRKARFVKLHLPTFFSAYDWVIWVDGNVMMCRNPEGIIEALDPDTFDFATYAHPERSGLLLEAAKCVQLGKDDFRIMAGHLQDNHAHPAFLDEGLYETMVMVLRPSSDAVRKMCAIWWRMLSRGSKRDQMSLPMAIADTPDLRVKALPHTINLTSDFARTRHRA